MIGTAILFASALALAANVTERRLTSFERRRPVIGARENCGMFETCGECAYGVASIGCVWTEGHGCVGIAVDPEDEFTECPKAKAEGLVATNGCHTITDREQCCKMNDGRSDKTYKNQRCVAAEPGKTINGRVCQPYCWAAGTCDLVNNNHPGNTGTNTNQQGALNNMGLGFCGH